MVKVLTEVARVGFYVFYLFAVVGGLAALAEAVRTRNGALVAWVVVALYCIIARISDMSSRPTQYRNNQIMGLPRFHR